MLDYVGIEEDLSQEEQLLVESARPFITSKVNDIGQHWIDGTFLTDLTPRWARWGSTGRTSRATASSCRN